MSGMHDTGSAIPMMSASVPSYCPKAAPVHYTRVVVLATFRGCSACLLKPTCCLLTGCVMFAAGDHEGEGWHIYRGQVPHEHASAGHCGPLPSITSLPCLFTFLSGLCACLSFLSICLPACPSIVPSVCLTVPFLQANLSVCMSV